MILGEVKIAHTGNFEVDELACPECDSDLVLHQPDGNRPERLLATCDECKAWFLIASDDRHLFKVLDSV